MLELLLDRRGSVVTREEVRQKLWAADTFVEFDRALNTAVNKVREALGDSANNPRFIETLARRGYRFLAPVEEVRRIQETNPPVAEPQQQTPS
jgi:DNA-binding winged helix-turn-helix (wHTH) protein